MLTGDIRNQIDRIWDAFWSGGISNPLEVMEQITYLLFLRRLDDLQTLEENKSTRLGRPIERRIFPEGNDPRGKPYAQLRWSRFKHAEAREMFAVVGEHVFPFLRTLGGDDSTYSLFHMALHSCLSHTPPKNIGKFVTIILPLLLPPLPPAITVFLRVHIQARAATPLACAPSQTPRHLHRGPPRCNNTP